MRQFQKQPPRGVPRKRCSENMQQVYKRTSMPKCDFNKVALQLQFVENPWFLATWATLSPFSVIHIVLPKNGALPFYNTNFLLTTSKISDKFDKPVPQKAVEDRQAEQFRSHSGPLLSFRSYYHGPLKRHKNWNSFQMHFHRVKNFSEYFWKVKELFR